MACAVRLPARTIRTLCIATCIALLLTGRADGAALTVAVAAADAPVDGAVVVLYDAAGRALSLPSRASSTHVMDQINKQFSPRVLAIRAGDAVSFPNSDDIRHHVYSFSPAKQFELPLYHGEPTSPVSFDVAGKVAMGCNIHDGMSADLFVVDSDVFAMTMDGEATFSDLPPGTYQVGIWHPQHAESVLTRRGTVELEEGASNRAFFKLDLQTAAKPAETTLSPLELKFRQLRRDKK